MNKIVQTVDNNEDLRYEVLCLVEPIVINWYTDDPTLWRANARTAAIAEIIPLISEWFLRPSIQFKIKTILGGNISSKKYRELRGEMSDEGFDWNPIASHYANKRYNELWADANVPPSLVPEFLKECDDEI